MRFRSHGLFGHFRNRRARRLMALRAARRGGNGILKSKLSLLAAAGLAGLLGPSAASGQVIVNPLSAFSITTDGAFMDGVAGSGEWSDVAPQAFVSPDDNTGTLFRTTVGDPNANSFLYAALAPGIIVQDATELYLLYDYLPRTSSFFDGGEFIADIDFLIDLPGGGYGGGVEEDTPITVQVRGLEEQFTPQVNGGPIPIDVTVDAGSFGTFDPDQLGMEVAVGFGPSPHAAFDHMIIELEVGLTVDQFFFNPNTFPQGQEPDGTGVYSPDPAFWGGNFANDLVDPPGTASVFGINPDGSTTVNSGGVPAFPEPATLGLLTAGGLLLLARRRTRQTED